MIENATEEQLETLTMIIYLITNNINKRNYVGQSIKNFTSRYKCKQWWKYIDNKELKSDIKKLGKENFNVSILRHDVSDGLILDILEDNYAIEYNAYFPIGYNIMKCGTHGGKLNTKTYKLKIYETGEIVIINNLNEFCRKNKFGINSISHVIHGRTLCSHGYTLPETNLDNGWIKKQKITLKNEYCFINPLNEKIVINNLRQFCKENKLDLYHMIQVADGKRKSYKFYSNSKNPIKFFKLVNAKGEIFLLREGEGNFFAKKHGISAALLKLLLREEKLVLGEWRLYKNMEIPPETPFRIKSPEDKIYEFFVITKFAKEFNLSYHSLIDVLRGKNPNHKGWTLP